MSQVIETVRVKCDVTSDNPHGFYVINKEDFNADQHQLFKDEVELEPTPAEPVVIQAQEQAAPWLRNQKAS